MLGLNLDGVESSYIQNHFGNVFYSIVRSERPKFLVELGSYQGYSALHMAMALRDNKDIESELHLVDLWDSYKYRHCSLASTVENFRKNDLLSVENCTIRFKNQDAYEIAAGYVDDSIDLLHIDISNDGASLVRCLSSWHQKLRLDATLLIEGGSGERDQVEWMTEFAKAPIQSYLESSWFSDHYHAVTIQSFPSLTIARRKK